jgi:tetratricopeptide (TPR) repeat protein
VEGEGKAVMPYPAVNFGFHKAADIAFAQFDENLKNSQKIAAYVSTKALADFQEKVNAWRALPKKSLPEEARRFRVLADDAVQNKEFDKAANYYEQGLEIDPMWPAGQFNAAMIYKELNSYAMAAMHLKRYLVLKPEDVKTYRDQMYIWEEKANEGNALSDNSNTQPAQSRGAY